MGGENEKMHRLTSLGWAVVLEPGTRYGELGVFWALVVYLGLGMGDIWSCGGKKVFQRVSFVAFLGSDLEHGKVK